MCEDGEAATYGTLTGAVGLRLLAASFTVPACSFADMECASTDSLKSTRLSNVRHLHNSVCAVGQTWSCCGSCITQPMCAFIRDELLRHEALANAEGLHCWR